MLAVTDTGIGMDAGDAGAHLRAVLHDQGEGQGHRARALDRLRHRPAERRQRLGLQRAGQGDDLQGLPAARGRRGRQPRALRTAAPRRCAGSETILLVEDDDQVRAVATDDPPPHGYHVIEARNAGEALLICESTRAQSTCS